MIRVEAPPLEWLHGEELPMKSTHVSRPEKAVDSGAEWLLQELEINSETIREANTDIDALIAAARSRGVTWVALGKAMGVDGNAVRQRMKRRERAKEDG